MLQQTHVWNTIPGVRLTAVDPDFPARKGPSTCEDGIDPWVKKARSWGRVTASSLSKKKKCNLNISMKDFFKGLLQQEEESRIIGRCSKTKSEMSQGRDG